MSRKKVSWNSLQRKIRYNKYVKLKEELRANECEMDVFICKFEQGLFFYEEVDFLEEWLAKVPCGGYCIEFNKKKSKLYVELELFEERIMNQGLHIHNEKNKIRKREYFLG